MDSKRFEETQNDESQQTRDETGDEPHLQTVCYKRLDRSSVEAELLFDDERLINSKREHEGRLPGCKDREVDQPVYYGLEMEFPDELVHSFEPADCPEEEQNHEFGCGSNEFESCVQSRVLLRAPVPVRVVDIQKLAWDLLTQAPQIKEFRAGIQEVIPN